MKPTVPQNRLKVLFALFFLISASIPLIFFAAGIDSPRFASEVRPGLPALVVDGRFNTAVTAEFDHYWSRSFPLNSWLVSRYNYLTGHAAASSTNPQVIWGRDGYLFFRETLNDMLHVPTLSDLELARIRTSLSIQQQYVEAEGSIFRIMIGPNKAGIYPDKLPPVIHPVTKASNAMRFLEQAGSLPVIDLFTPLRNLAAEAPVTVYHRLDSHWNNLGAIEACRVMMEAVDMEPLQLTGPLQETRDFQGDLATMFYPDRKTLDSNYQPADFTANFISVRPMRTLEDITIETIQRDRTGSLLMFRDSFANALIPYISSSVGDVTYLRQDRPDYRAVSEKQPDAVVLEIAERNLDWWLQATPILPAPKTRLPETAKNAVTADLDYEVISTENYGLFHTNVRLDVPHPFTRVLVQSAEETYEAFPLFEDGVVDDHSVIPGFSLYTTAPLGELRIYLGTGRGWIRLN